MKYEFTFKGKKHQLDTITGNLIGEFASDLRIIVDRAIGFTTGGHPSSPFDSITITTPYHDITQFTMAIVKPLGLEFPKELKGYVKFFKTNEPDMSNWTKEKIEAYKDLTALIVY